MEMYSTTFHAVVNSILNSILHWLSHVLPVILWGLSWVFLLAVDTFAGDKLSNISGSEEIEIYHMEPDPRGGRAYKLVYIVEVPIDIYWRFKTDFDNDFLLNNKYIRKHRLVSRSDDTVITKNRYTMGPDADFKWETTVLEHAHRLEFVLLNPEQCGQRFHHGYIELSLEEKETRVTQLNYIIWFPSRPKIHALDIYGGMLDGLNYRVTLDTHGEPLLYESVHHCGCYYAAYPTRRLKIREKIPYKEPPLILKAPDIQPDRQWMTVAMKSRTHFVRHLYPSGFNANSDTVVYNILPYDQLRSLNDAHGGHRSMFDPDSLAPGTRRLERWLFWPTGVYSAGAMRQSGRHAVAFAGRRHFDDPFFMEKMFEKL
jgi:hypothetical protein